MIRALNVFQGRSVYEELKRLTEGVLTMAASTNAVLDDHTSRPSWPFSESGARNLKMLFNLLAIVPCNATGSRKTMETCTR